MESIRVHPAGVRHAIRRDYYRLRTLELLDRRPTAVKEEYESAYDLAVGVDLRIGSATRDFVQRPTTRAGQSVTATREMDFFLNRAIRT